MNLISIDKESIGWREEKVVEFTYTHTINEDLEAQMLQTDPEGKAIMVDGKLYDNTGKLVSTSPQGGQVSIQFAIMNRKAWHRLTELLKQKLTPEQMDKIDKTFGKKYGSPTPNPSVADISCLRYRNVGGKEVQRA